MIITESPFSGAFLIRNKLIRRSEAAGDLWVNALVFSPMNALRSRANDDRSMGFARLSAKMPV